MPTKLPKISVIMPVLNAAATIERAIQSVVEQHYLPVELIILDGGSKDGTLKIIKQYADNIAYWHSEGDKGAAAATNTGIEKATGDLIVLLMADDWFHPGTFAQIAQAYLKNPNADILTCAGQIVRYEPQTKMYVEMLSYNTEKILELNFYNICYAVSAICVRFFKKSLFTKIGLFIPHTKSGSVFLTNDKEFLLRAMLQRAQNVFVDYLGHSYLAHPGSFSFNDAGKNKQRHCEEHIEIAELYLVKKDLSKRSRWFFIFWRNEQSARLVFHQLISMEWRKAMLSAKSGFIKNKSLWPFIFLGAGINLGFKKLKVTGLRFLK